MTKVVSILHKVLVNYFYKVNAGLFLFLFFVFFGLPYSPLAFHFSLINGIIKSQLFLALVMLIWLLYNLKCVDYILKQIQHPHQSFLVCLNCLPNKKVYLYFLWVQVLVYMPILLYAIAIIIIAYKKQEYLCGLETLFFNLLILLLTPFAYLFALQRRHLVATNRALPGIQLKLPKPYFLYPLYFLFGNRKQMLLTTKFFSLLFLYGFMALYDHQINDVRPIQLCLLLVAASHCAIIYETRLFEEEYLEFTKNLPFTIIQRFLQMAAMYFCLLLPEIIILIKGINVQYSLIDFPGILLFLIALLCLFYTALILEHTNMEQLVRIVFGIMAGCFFIILYNPGIILPVAILALSFALYNAYYYYYEKRSR